MHRRSAKAYLQNISLSPLPHIGKFFLVLQEELLICPVMKANTSFKIGCGYFLLVCLLLGSIYYIYNQTIALTRMSDEEESLMERRKATHQLISQLFETENIAQTIHLGHWEAYRKYVESMAGVRQTLLRLDSLLTDSLQQARLDTLAILLENKQENMKRLVQAIEDNKTDQIYRRQINLFIQSQDTVIQKPYITQQIIQKDESYTVKSPKKNFFQRLASAFHKPEEDTTAVTQTVQILATDTIHQEFNARDTIAHILDSIENDIEQYNSRRKRIINARAEKLWYAGMELNNRVNQLMESIEREEQHRIETISERDYRIRKQAALTTGFIAIAAILLAVVFFIIVWRDITRSNHYRRELEKAKKKAEDLLVSREKLMLTVTHDIKAPVGSIMGYTDLLAPVLQDQRARNYLGNIRDSSQHLLSLVGSLLDYHKLEANKMDLRPVSFNPSELLHTIARSFLPLAEKKGLALRCETTEDTARTYTGDAFRIRQIVENLTSNALKFTKAGSVSLRAKMHGRQLCLTVSDTGCGMTPEEQKVIFKEFTRLSSAQGEEGVGLGLSITLKLVQLLKGEIHLESAPGKGSSFFVILPLQPASAPQDAPQTPPASRPERPLRILLIDDDPIQMQLTQAMLHQLQEGKTLWETVACRQPQEVFTLAARQHFDLLLTDIQMPSMDGFELLRRLRQLPNPANPALPVIAITARSDMDEAFFRQNGFATCLYKPFNRNDLTRAMDKALGTLPAPPPPAAGEDKAVRKPDFSALTAFAGNDPEASRDILDTFRQETQRNAQAFRQACRQKDKAEACRLAHKLLPTFTLVNASCTADLQTLERRRDEKEWQEADNVPAQNIMAAFDEILRALEAEKQ